MKFKVLIEYDGTKYSGWQKQINTRSVQGTLIESIKKVFSNVKGDDRFIDLQGSGRTDSGVHALEQTAHMECITNLSPEILKIKINDELPSDINILKIIKVKNNFHARHSAKSRQYLYRISTRRTAFQKRYVWWIKDKLELEKMQKVSELFLGMHNFKSFADLKNSSESAKVKVESLTIEPDDEFILIRIKASHFLWKMVRRIVGVLVEAGRGKMNIDNVESFLNSYSNEPSKFTAPPSGLFLEKVFY